MPYIPKSILALTLVKELGPHKERENSGREVLHRERVHFRLSDFF